jgi:hypothetical protein
MGDFHFLSLTSHFLDNLCDGNQAQAKLLFELQKLREALHGTVVVD